MKTKKPNGYWNKERCLNDALKYDRRVDWQKKSSSAYGSANKNGWLNSCTSHMSEIRKPNGYWNKENCIDESKKYKTITEWSKKSSISYKIARENKWLNECIHFVRIGSKYKRLIYVFEFPDKSVYVGLTYNSQKRKLEHLNDKKSPVYIYSKNTNLVPIFKEITNYIESDIASKQEEEILNDYKKMEWNILNIAKTGGLGGNSKKWTMESCEIAALKCRSRNEFQKKYGGAYKVARQNNWLDICYQHMNHKQKMWNYWTLNRCKEDALNYKSRSEWRKNSGSAYNAAMKNKWDKKCCEHMINLLKPDWSKENCIIDAKLYNSKSEWQRNSGSAYNAAYRNKWMYDCTKHMMKIN